MKTIMILCSFVSFLTIGEVRAESLQPRTQAPCVGLEHIERDGSRTHHCIRDRDPGTRFTLLEFFQTSCSDCHQSRPRVSQLGKEIAGSTTTRFIAVDRSEAAVVKYLSEHKSEMDFSVGLDLEGDARRAYRVDSTPTLFVLNSQNTVIHTHTGPLTAASAEQIRKLVK